VAVDEATGLQKLLHTTSVSCHKMYWPFFTASGSIELTISVFLAAIGFWLATHHAERFTSFILGGQSPYRYAEITFKLVQEAIETYKLQLIDPEAALQRRQDWFGGNRPLTDREKSTFLAEDAQTLALLYSSYLDWPTLSDQDLSRISLPCLILCGELDEGGHFPGARESAHCIPNARFISFPSIGHYLSELFLPPIKEFLAEMSKK
jgi:pimeloyl-ACP methyl ester carboxylesterase